MRGKKRRNKTFSSAPGVSRQKGRKAQTQKVNAPDYDLNKVKRNKRGGNTLRNGIRLNKYIADCGVCSRREADELIAAGAVSVNGKIIQEHGVKVYTGDEVKCRDKLLAREKLVYVLLNKPKDYITTLEDPGNRKTVMNLLKNVCPERIYPVGRLDRNTTGLLLLTNDGDLTKKLTHPSHKVKKIYQVELDKPLHEYDADKIATGIELEDGMTYADAIAFLSNDRKLIGVEIHSGKNRVIRRIFHALGYDIVKLDRTVFAGLDKKKLPRGKWRFLTEREVIKLKHLS